MEIATNINAVGFAIQHAVAPVFLLAGVGSLLAVLTSRLSRIIDRVHSLERELPDDADDAMHAKHLKSARPLSRRARLIHWAISLCTTCELLVCVVVATLFIGAELGIDLSSAIALLFMRACARFRSGNACADESTSASVQPVRLRR
jgi:hypothetical protein